MQQTLKLAHQDFGDCAGAKARHQRLEILFGFGCAFGVRDHHLHAQLCVAPVQVSFEQVCQGHHQTAIALETAPPQVDAFMTAEAAFLVELQNDEVALRGVDALQA